MPCLLCIRDNAPTGTIPVELVGELSTLTKLDLDMVAAFQPWLSHPCANAAMAMPFFDWQATTKHSHQAWKTIQHGEECSQFSVVEIFVQCESANLIGIKNVTTWMMMQIIIQARERAIQVTRFHQPTHTVKMQLIMQLQAEFGLALASEDVAVQCG